MSDLFVDAGYLSRNKFGEMLCGDHVEIVRQSERALVMVLADGLGSGVKASILSTLTAKIISTMMANEMCIESCVHAISATLPVCDTLKIAYSTFTVVSINERLEATIIQFDNPHVFILRDGRSLDYSSSTENIGGKTIYRSTVALQENDAIVCMSDGAVFAGTGISLNLGFTRDAIIEFMQNNYSNDYSAKILATLLSDECCRLYQAKHGDDTTICAVKVIRRKPVNLLIGPPSSPSDDNKMLSLFFSKEGKRIVCGGTTAKITASFLNKPVDTAVYGNVDPRVPPIAHIEGVDLTTEGVITLSRVVDYVDNYMGSNDLYIEWAYGNDGASRLIRMLVEATDINLFVGRAINSAHKGSGLPIGFSEKMRLVEHLSARLKQIGKRIKISYF